MMPAWGGGPPDVRADTRDRCRGSRMRQNEYSSLASELPWADGGCLEILRVKSLHRSVDGVERLGPQGSLLAVGQLM